MTAAEIAGDADALAALLADDVVIVPPAVEAIEGKPACVEMIRHVMSRNASEIDRRSLVYTTLELTITGVVAVERGVYEHDFVLTDSGLPHRERGQYLRVYRRAAGGTWFAHRIIWNLLYEPEDEAPCDDAVTGI